ncbi:MAG: glycosyltransferase family 39 protein, partial [Anaerolineales bacterium]
MPSRNHPVRKFIADNWLLFAILLLALFLRLFYFVGVVRGDDFAYTYYAHKLSQGELQVTGPYPGIDRPGLYAPVAVFFSVFGVGEFVATLFPLLASLVTILFIYQIGFLLAGKKAALLSAFFWAVFPLSIFMATQVDPETPLTMATTGAIYFLLMAHGASKLAFKALWFLFCALFLVWAFLTKLSSVPILFVIAALLVYWSRDRLRGLLTALRKKSLPIRRVGGGLLFLALVAAAVFVSSKQPWPIVINNLELTSYDMARPFIGRSNPVQRSDVGGDYWIINRDVFDPPVEPDVLTQPTAGNRFKLFDPFLLVFLIAIGYGVVQRKISLAVPLIWFALLFFYFEWGPFPRSLSHALTFVYVPVTHWIAHDNLLYLCVPLVLVVSIYLAEGLDLKSLGAYFILAVVSVFAFSLALDYLPTRELALNYMELSLVFVVALSLLSSIVLLRAGIPKSRKTTIFGLLVPLIGIASLLPSAHYHAWDFFKEKERRENLHAVVTFLEDQPELPFFAGFNAMPLDFYSGYQYGFAYLGEEYNYPQTRMTTDRELIAREGGFFLRAGCREPVFSLSNWALAEFGDPASTECFSLVRSLPADRAQVELAEARNQVTKLLTQDAISAYLAAAANAENLPEFIHALSLYATYFPDDIPISQAQGLILA